MVVVFRVAEGQRRKAVSPRCLAEHSLRKFAECDLQGLSCLEYPRGPNPMSGWSHTVMQRPPQPTVSFGVPTEDLLDWLMQTGLESAEEVNSGPSARQRVAVGQSLPFLTSREDALQGRHSPEIWIVSFTEVKPRLYCVTIHIEYIGTRYDRTSMIGKVQISLDKPTAPFMVAAILSAMTEPRNSVFGAGQPLAPPHRPLQILLAYRLKYAKEEISDAMFSCGIACELESKREAKKSARDNGTDYKGRNASKRCATCGNADDRDGLKCCARCRQVWYCSRACQQADWKEHKPSCFEAASSEEEEEESDDACSDAVKGANSGSLTGWNLRMHGLKGRPELNGEHGTALSFDTERGRYAMELRHGEKVLIRPENLEPAATWEVENASGQWVPYSPPKLQQSIERLYVMSSPHYLFTPGNPDCEGMYEPEALAGRSVGQAPPAGVATHRITFEVMKERALYTGCSRSVRRRGPSCDAERQMMEGLFGGKPRNSPLLYAMREWDL